jgi:hypothetical protein
MLCSEGSRRSVNFLHYPTKSNVYCCRLVQSLYQGSAPFCVRASTHSYFCHDNFPYICLCLNLRNFNLTEHIVVLNGNGAIDDFIQCYWYFGKTVSNYQKTIRFILPVEININTISCIASFTYSLQD